MATEILDKNYSLEETISTFRLRASSSRKYALTVLILILTLLAGAAVAFVYAPTIANNDIINKTDYDKRISAITPEIEELRNYVAERSSIAEIQFKAEAEKYQEWLRFASSCMQYIYNTNGAFYLERSVVVEPDIIIDESNACKISEIVERINNISPDRDQIVLGFLFPGQDKSEMSFRQILKSNRYQFLDTLEKNNRIAKKERVLVPSRNYIADPKKTERLNLLSSALNALQNRKRFEEVQQLSGLKSPDKSDSTIEIEADRQLDYKSDIVHLIQTNVNRFGTIILIIFLVSILTPLYRYNMKLSAYYDARADALMLGGAKA